MVKSMTLAAKVPHFHYVEDMKCNAILKLKGAFQNANSDPNVKFTCLPVFIKSLSMALRTYPMLNSCFHEDLYEVTIKGSESYFYFLTILFSLSFTTDYTHNLSLSL